MDGYLSAVMQKFYALMICGGDDLHGVNSWVTEEDVIREVKINHMAECFLSGGADSDREQDGSFSTSLQIIIYFGCDHLINNVFFSISGLLDEL